MIPIIDEIAAKKFLEPQIPYCYNMYCNDDEFDNVVVSDFKLNSPKLVLLRTPNYTVTQKIERLQKLEGNWDGYGGLPLSETVASNSKAIIELLDENLFLLNSYDTRISPYDTFILEWFDNNGNEFSLEIGTETLAYYSEGKHEKSIDSLDISTPKHIFDAAQQIEEDVKISL